LSIDTRKIKFQTDGLNLFYNTFRALKDVNISLYECTITAIIGPSGCGKSSLLRIFNRMNDLIPKSRVEGNVLIDNEPIYDKGVDVAALRKRVGMVFQKPNVFPTTIYDNIAVGPRNHGIRERKQLDEIVESSLMKATLWDEVKDIYKKSNGLELLPGQQQRLCIARALAVEPEVILMDESCSALDHMSTLKIEELMLELAKKYTILIVTHNMEQALRVSDMSAFLMIDEDRAGIVVEYEPTLQMFTSPKDKRTEDYITGRFG